MNTRKRRLLHIILILTVMLAVFARTAYAAPDPTTTTTTATTIPDITEPTTAPVTATGENGEPVSTEPPEPTEPTTLWEPPTDEEGNTLYPPLPSTEASTIITTTTKRTTTTTHPPFEINPAHPEDKYKGALWYVTNPDLYNDVTTIEGQTTIELSTIEGWEYPDEAGYQEGSQNMRRIVAIAAAALLLVALSVAIAMIVKGNREARERARITTAKPRPAISAATPLLNPLPPPAGLDEDVPEEGAANEAITDAPSLAGFSWQRPFSENISPAEIAPDEPTPEPAQEIETEDLPQASAEEPAPSLFDEKNFFAENPWFLKTLKTAIDDYEDSSKDAPGKDAPQENDGE